MTEPRTTSPRSTGPASTTVLIVGAGPTGLTLACELARRQVPFRLIEAAPGPQPGSRGKGLQPRTLEVFDDLGIVDEVLAHGQPAMPIRSTDPHGRVTSGGAVPENLQNRPDIPYAASLITPQWRTEEILRRRLDSLGGAVDFGTALVELSQDGDGQVRATLSEYGATGTITARWLVGCDGGHSLVRKQVGIAFDGETRNEVRMLVADIAVDGLGRDAWHMWRHEEGLVSLCPLPSTPLFQYQASISPGQDPGLGLANLKAILERRTARSDLHLHEPEWSSLWRANVRLAERYRVGQVFLAGDAAHIHSPAGGQGMNTGIQDAYNLGWKLATVVVGSRPALLDSYEAERRPVAAHVLALSDARLQQTIDQGRMPLHRDRTTTQLDVGYRSSPLAKDDRDPSDDSGLHAGDRAPDAIGLETTSGVRRLFDLTRGCGWTLLDFGPRTATGHGEGITTFYVREASAAPDEVADPSGRLRSTYAGTDQTQILIRPDGYIGLINDDGDPSAVSSYLSTVTAPEEKPCRT